MTRLKSLTLTALTLVIALGLSGCSSRGNPRDPYEGFNRSIYSFNEGLDKVVLKPAAEGYEALLPDAVRTAVSNVFGNIADVFIGVNNLLQGKIQDGGSDFGRVAINSSFGILGIFDVATAWGIEKHEEDFGQTLGSWGVGDGPYLMLPVFGPRTLRDTVGLAADMAVEPVSHSYPVDTRNTAQAVRLVSKRAELLPVEPALEEAAMGDKYGYIRDAYLQRRRSLIYDGNPPRPKDDE